MVKKIFTYLLIICVLLCSGCSPRMTQEQRECEHQWSELVDYEGLNAPILIYCPVCKLEKKVSLEDWRKMQVDQNFECQ